MKKFTHRTMICFSGLVWLLVGVFLLTFGIFLVMGTLRTLPFSSQFSLIRSFGSISGSLQNGVLILLFLALFLGYLKGRFILSRSARRQISRILSLTPPIPLTRLYSLGYYFLIGLMIGLGMLMRFLPCAQDVRGGVDITIGGALISGGLTYFRFLLTDKSKVKDY